MGKTKTTGLRQKTKRTQCCQRAVRGWGSRSIVVPSGQSRSSSHHRQVIDSCNDSECDWHGNGVLVATGTRAATGQRSPIIGFLIEILILFVIIFFILFVLPAGIPAVILLGVPGGVRGGGWGSFTERRLRTPVCDWKPALQAGDDTAKCN